MLIKELYDYREMIFSLVRRDLKGRYKNSVLGFLWTFVNPLLQLAVYTFVFSFVMPMGIDHYSMHLFVGLVPWLFFATCLTGGARVILDQQDMVKKIHFPREVLPVAYVTSQFVNMVLSGLVVIVMLFITGIGIDLKALLYLPIVMLVQYAFTLGITLICSAITVYVRDLEQILAAISLAWIYMTPVVYPITIIPEEYMQLYMLNPMTPIIVAYRDIMFYGQVPQMDTLTVAVIWGVVMLVIGLWIFGKLKKHFAEEL